MRWIEVKGSKPLRGAVSIPGSKNSSLALLAACCLASEPVILKNIPLISDIDLICSISQDISLNICRKEHTMIVDSSGIKSADIDIKKSSAYRASYYLAGALLSRFKKVSVGYPGGDNFGSRPIDQHIKGLEALGAKVTLYKDYYTVEAEKLIGTTIYFDVITSGATMNIILAAVMAEGKTVLLNAARDPEVVDLSIMLNKMGARIKGMGTNSITIEGVRELHGCEHTVIPDRLIAGTFMIAAGATRGNIKVKDVTPEHLLSCMAKLEEAGMCFEVGDNYIESAVKDKIYGVNVKAAMYPSFATDLQQPLTAMLLNAESHSTIADTVYPERINHCIQLNRMGADIIMKEDRFVIPGNRKLIGNWVHATDVRAGICLLLAGMIAEGTTRITGVEHIERGYTNIIDTFISLGADVKMKEDIAADKESREDFESML